MEKKKSLAALSAVLVLTIVLTMLVVPSFASRKLGDVDGDGFVTSADARSALRASVQLDKLTAEQTLAADVDEDGFVTSADARLILRAAVQLQALPDKYVGEDVVTSTDAQTPDESTTLPEPESTTLPEPETTTLPEPETTTLPEPETTTLPEPETTTLPEPETTTLPEPETTTQPEATDDFIPPAENNEFDILRSGTYYFRGLAMEGSEKNEMEVAKTKDSQYISSDFKGVKVAILKADGKTYFVNPDKKTYIDLTDKGIILEMKALKLDASSFTEISAFDFSPFPPLEAATRSEKVSGGYVKYVFEAPAGAINVTMDGKTLICLENARNGSVYRIDFYEVSDQVPVEMSDVGKLTKALGAYTFFISLLSSLAPTQ